MTNLPLTLGYDNMEEKRERLHLLCVNGNSGEFSGFYNDEKIGVCMTNALLTLIISSPKLLEEVRRIVTVDRQTIHEQMEKVILDPNGENFEICSWMKVEEYLGQSLLDATQRDIVHSKYGTAGNYYLLKNYLRNLKERKLKRNFPSSNSSSIMEMCYDIINDQKMKYRSFINWHKILSDLFHRQIQRAEWKCDNIYDEWKYMWYGTLNFLNIQLDPFDRNPLYFWKNDYITPNIFDLISSNGFKRLDRSLNERTSIPKFISINFNFETKEEFHPSLIKCFGDKIYEIISNDNKHYDDAELFDEIDILLQFKSLKLSHFPYENNSIFLRFPLTNTGDSIYELRGITFCLVENNIHNISTIRHLIKKFNIDYSNEKHIDCSSYLYRQIENYISTFHTREIISNISSIFKLNIIEILKKICAYFQLLHDRDYLEASSDCNCHFYSLIKGTTKWMLMNDDDTLIIDDVKDAHQSLTLEMVNSLFFEIKD
ncbi:hypothetical protein SNEBB_009288 [Seison nebaliae]|nr:hypothetical protein SNEBB_009288 [Seison nebaliae]